MSRSVIDDFYMATKFQHDGNTVYIRRNGEMFTRHYASGVYGSVIGCYTDATIGYWPELADQMWAETPAIPAVRCATCGRVG